MACVDGVWRAWRAAVVVVACGVRRRMAAAKAGARQGQRGHEPGRFLSLAAMLMLLARRSMEDPPERREAVQCPRAGLLARALPAASTGKGHAAVGGRRGHEPGRLLSLAATLMLLARRSTEDPPERREAVQRPHAGLLARALPATSTGKGPRRWGGGAVMSPAGCSHWPPR